MSVICVPEPESKIHQNPQLQREGILALQETSLDSPLVRIVGQAPIQADVYRLQRLRCNTCGDVFTAETPEGVGSEKYDATSTSMVALMKYGSGFPFHRLERLEANLGISLPASTQWEMVGDYSETLASLMPASPAN